MWFEFYPVLKEITLCLRQFFVSMKQLLLKMTLLIVVPYSTVCVHCTMYIRGRHIDHIFFQRLYYIRTAVLRFLILGIQVLQYAKKSKSPHKNRACHGWSRGKGILLCPCVFLFTVHIFGPETRYSTNCCICSNHDKLGFYAEIQICVGTVYFVAYCLISQEHKVCSPASV